MAAEKDVENEIKAHVRASGGFVDKIFASNEQGRCTLDLVGSYRGKPFFVEVKSPTGYASKIQAFVALRARRGGYISGIVRSLDDFEALFIEPR